MTTTDPPPSPEAPLGGRCLCAGVRFEVSAPFVMAAYCHCTHCQRRTGTAVSASARVPRSGFRLLTGADLLESYQPTPESNPKVFCRRCGSHLFSGDPFGGELVAIRLGVLDGDPGIRPEFRQWVDSAAFWEPIPDDGLPRHSGSGST
ncbi:MAG: GFA family protein [Solirubrobacteraceae bacterium]